MFLGVRKGSLWMLALWIGLFVLWGCDGSSGAPGTGCGSIAGKVTLDGRGVRHVGLTLTGNSLQRTATTNMLGAYEFRNVPSGIFKVTMTPPDGYTGTPTLTVVKTTARNVGNVHFAMQSDTIRRVASGMIIGKREENGIAAWYGVPFAKPPVNDLRWKAPQPETHWAKTLIATTPCQPCTQYVNMLSNYPASYDGQAMGSEDCLYLNIWAPDTAGRKPVMFWVHGGGNSIGEGAAYNGKMLAEKYDVVVVAINYRLGPLGWFAHPALRRGPATLEDRSGNFGTLDIIRALEWVQANIAAFGGDQNKVTLFGESAGGFNTLSMLASPLSAGLFHRAIAQSPVIAWVAGNSTWQPMSVAENYVDDAAPGYPTSSRETVNRLLMADGLAADRQAAKRLQDSMADEAVETYLRAMPAAKLISAYGTEPQFGGMIIMPTGIQDGYVIPRKDPLSVFKAGEFHKVPIMLGTNRDEYKLFLMMDPNYALSIMGTIPLVIKPRNYELAAKYYSNMWKVTAVDEVAAAIRLHQPDDIYVYRFDWDEEPDIMGLVDLSFMVGAAHGTEIPYVFADPGMVLMDLMVLTYTPDNKQGRIALAQSMSSYWAAMAYDGTPGTGRPQAPQAVAWTPWTNGSGEKNLMVFDTPADAGVHMADVHLCADDIKNSLQSETGFRKAADHCRVYGDIFGVDDFYQANCSGR
jgi:para-nitrobenzyl esterase